MKHAVVENGVVTNIVIADADFAASKGWIQVNGIVDIGYLYDGTSFSENPAINENKVKAEAEKVRETRNKLLAETDWWASSDLTITQEQIAYRQALRDITIQDGFPFNVTWPTKP